MENGLHIETGPWHPHKPFTRDFFLAQALQWRYSNGCDGVSNHRRPGCLLNHLFWCRSKKTSKALCHWPLWGEFTGDQWIPLTRASNAENVCIWWHHHGLFSVEQDFSQWETNGLMKKRCNSSVLAMELHLFCIKPLADIIYATPSHTGLTFQENSPIIG